MKGAGTSRPGFLGSLGSAGRDVAMRPGKTTAPAARLRSAFSVSESKKRLARGVRTRSELARSLGSQTLLLLQRSAQEIALSPSKP
jgi:hypothetical protein